VTYTVRATGKDKSGQNYSQTVPVWCLLKMDDDKWRFAEFREEKILEK